MVNRSAKEEAAGASAAGRGATGLVVPGRRQPTAAPQAAPAAGAKTPRPLPPLRAARALAVLEWLQDGDARRAADRDGVLTVEAAVFRLEQWHGLRGSEVRRALDDLAGLGRIRLVPGPLGAVHIVVVPAPGVP